MKRTMNWRILLTALVLFCEISSAQNCEPSALPPDPTSGCCGQALAGAARKRRSITKINEYPWMAIVEYKDNEKIKLFCGAVLISGRYALSAAFCFEGTILDYGIPVNLRLGEYDVSNDGPDCVVVNSGSQHCTDGAVIIPIEKVIVHPNLKIKTRQNDIALIKLARTAPYTDFIRPICLPSLDITVNASERLFMTVTGWGAVNETNKLSNVLRQARVPFVSLDICHQKYNESQILVNLTESHLCAGGKYRDACKGDGGGPLIYLNRNVSELAGIVSFGAKPCGSDVPGVYTKVFAFKDWIRETIEEEENPIKGCIDPKTMDYDAIIFRD